MTRLVMFCVLALAATGARADDKKDVPKDLAPFQGTWKVAKAAFGGESVPDAEKDKLKFVFAGEKVTVKEGMKDDTGSYSVDPKKDPAEIDLVSPKGEKILGIYKFEKDGKLTLTFVKGKDAARPKKFDDKDAVMMVLEKVKE